VRKGAGAVKYCAAAVDAQPVEPKLNPALREKIRDPVIRLFSRNVIGSE
jgi:hypothetical protein